jgi:Rod binding domain-containing protein
MSDLRTQPLSSPQTAAAVPASSTVPSPRLVSAAHEFEAQMMKELMAPLESGHDLLGAGDDEGSSSALGSFASEALGKAISEHGGLGIAKSILHQLTAQSNHSGNASVPAILNGTTTKSSFQ